MNDLRIKIDRITTPQSQRVGGSTIIHPEFELLRPSEYRISEIMKSIHPDQERGKGGVNGTVLYDWILQRELLPVCLSLLDGGELLEQGLGKQFGSDLWLFGSISKAPDGTIVVPSLCNCGIRGLIRWMPLEGKIFTRVDPFGTFKAVV